MTEQIKFGIEIVARGVEITGVLVIALGAVYSLARFFLVYQGVTPRSYRLLRQDLCKAILLGLEILVAADIIATVVTQPTLERVLTLGLIVLIRTFLSLSLQVELEGKFPWQRGPEEKPVTDTI